MDPAQLLIYAQVAEAIVRAGIATGEEIATWFRSLKGHQMTDAEMDVICDTIADDALRREVLARADAAAARAEDTPPTGPLPDATGTP